MPKNSERGQSTAMYVVSVMASLGTLGLVVDVGYSYYRKHVAQAAAESAALAMASAAATSCSISCGVNGVACLTDPTVCPVSIPNPPTSTMHNACLYAQTNGFAVTATGRQNVTVTSGTGTPPTLTGITVPYWATVRIAERIPQTFSAVLGNTHSTVSARATAAAIGGNSGGGCIYVLDPSGSGLTFSGTGRRVTSGCGIYVESGSSSAILSSGNNTITTTGGAKTWVHGNISYSGTLTISPSAMTGVANPSPADPYASWFASQTAPATTPCTGPSVSLSGSTSQTLNPGVYCSTITLSGSSSIVLNSGVYVLKGGIANSSSGPTSGPRQGIAVDGTAGVMIYMYTGGITGSGAGVIQLSPQSSGTWKGISFWQPSSNSSAEAFSGNTTQFTSGMIYMPNGTLTYSGGSSTSQSTLVVKDVVFSGTSQINTPVSAAGTGSCTSVSLIE